MISDFNYFNQPEQPILTLCNPDDTELGVITNAEDVSLSIRFNDISDLSYKIYQSDDEEYNDRVYNKHIERRQVNVAGVGYFIITGVSEVEDDDGVYKNIQAKSCEYELNNIAAPYINGTYCLYKPENFDADSNEQIAQRDDEYLNKNCVLYEVMKVIPAWRLEQIKFVEGEQKYIDLASTFRTFESSDTTVYSFFKSEIQKNYNCFVEFDIEHRIVRVLHYDDVFIEEPVILSRANVLNSCEVSTTIDNYINTFNVEGQDGVSIASCNPMGNTLIYNFDHDINTGLIDGVLKDALIYWKENLITNPNFSLTKDKWILLPEFVSEWEGFNSALLKVQEDILKTVSNVKESGEAEKTLREEVYKSTFPTEADSDTIANLKESLSWWYSHNYMSDDSKSSFDAYGVKSDLLTALKTLLNPNLEEIPEDDYYLFGITMSGNAAVLSDEHYAKNIEAFFNQSTILAKACYMKDLASYGITHSDVFSSLGDYNKLLLCVQNYLSKISSEADKINSHIKGYQAQLASISTTQVEESANREALDKQQSLLEEYINNSNNALEIYENIKLELNSTVNTIQIGVRSIYNHNSFEESFERFLSENTEHTITASELYANLTRYFKQQTYTNDTIVITDAMGDAEKYAQERDLYNESVDLLKELSIPAYEVNIGAESFMMTPVFKDVLNGMNIKSAFYVELPNNDVPLFHLLEININYEEKSCEFKLGNRLNISNPAAILSELQATASSAASIVAAERINWGINEEKVNQLMEAKNADIDTTFRIMKNSINNTSIGADGLRCYALDEDGNPTHGFWGANGVLMFTDGTDGSDPKMAVGRILKSDGSYEYGLYGQSIIANTITADKIMAGAVSKGTNYIKNGSFEAHNNKSPSNWTIAGSGQVEDEYGTPIGSRYLLSSSQSTITQVLESALNPGTYTLSFYYSGGKADVSICNGDTVLETCEYGDHLEEINHNASSWYRCYKSFNIYELITSPKVKITCDAYTKIDGVMLEKSYSINEYSPYLNEMFAKYTTVDDSGITVYDGKIRILNNGGTTVFSADEGGNLILTGTITAEQGLIGKWKISSSGLSSNNTYMSTDTGQDYVFYSGDGKKRNFSVTHNGLLYARAANIEETLSIYNGEYKIVINGSSIDMIYNTNSPTTSSISFASTGNNITGGGSNANLALAGYEKILFGIRPEGTWNSICELGMSKTLITNNDVLYFAPAPTAFFEEAYLGTPGQPWTSLYIKSTLLKVTKKMEPELITFATGIVGGVPILASRYFLCSQL